MDFINYGKQTVQKDDIDSVVEVLQSDFLTTGPKVVEFEKAICDYVGVSYCVAVSNGTAALHLASLALLKEKDKVLTTPNSFLATSNSIIYANAKPIFVDIKEDGNIDLELCEKFLKEDSSIEVLYAVHFSGNPIEQEKLAYLKERYNIKILEDCAHSLGASYNDIKAGSCKNSDISIFSFHPVKNITTGEGGAITTNSKEIYKKLLFLRNHGMIKDSSMKPWEYEMRDLGFNYRLTDIQCALGLSQLKKLDKFLKKRKAIAQKYDEAFKTCEIIKPIYPFFEGSAYHLYVVRVDFKKVNLSKEELFYKMRESGIGLQLHYIPINKQPFYKNLGYGKEITPIMDRYYEEVISLPIFPSLDEERQNYVIKSLKGFLNA
ncbi:UDP-4-amino-4,6-dideoxy-N-acetyl-beta-L-altrosamine transaminase [Halarcobacter ebronensis]|uniref:UDP-4-amino-4,6-dideoxy-N-acetyl-beta-L-altrosamine transaminase n=1 Tax=Halarcobacter ebronensis TaxID=1462615 RepID=A0A4Q0Y999_9BACT|nr:UDP-4-amino-4,6-dideoxy-N-acetyl-beta-L-altrosamine transaminase [Halarcobacter ebronensis]RXJ66827.1 UDP-4-amino-4,6-dideoxy-N-acetyl-beta-L-altrosamine transaminase [Halarcobacter ebronensis]